MLIIAQAFLLDDSGSMHSYWNTELKGVFQALFGLLIPLDTNGIEVYCAMSTTENNFKAVEDAVAFVSAKRPSPHGGQADISNLLGQILDEYRESLESNTSKRRSLLRVLTRRKKPLTLFVLTDGIWQTHSDPANVIKDTVGTLRKLNKTSTRQVGIEFIRFGNDEHAIQKLERLDSGLGLDP